MKKFIFRAAGLMILLVFFTSCPNPVGPEGTTPPAPLSSFTVTFDADGGTPVPAVQTVTINSYASKPAVDPVKDSLTFMYWKDSEGKEFRFSQTPITSNITLTAHYVDNELIFNVTIQKNIDEAGTVTVNPDRTVFTNGESFTLTAAANTGYRFTSWSGTVTGTDPVLAIEEISANVDVTANFEKVYTITTSAENADVTLNPLKDWYEEGEVVTVSITPDEGYQFLGWTGALSGKNRTETLTVGTQNLTIGADIVERWLVFIHFALDNDIDYNFEANYGIITHYTSALETVEAGDTDDVMDILVLMDGYTASDPRGNGYKTPFTDGYYKLTGENFADDLVKATGEINSGSIQTSKNFVDWAYTNNKGKRVMYSVFNHGSGFDDLNEAATYGIGFDDSNNGDSLSHKELAQVTAYIKSKAGKNIDLFYPYACLMGGVELAWEVKDNADYLLCSEEVFPAERWSYEALSAITADPQITGENLGKAICDDAYDFFSDSLINRNLTLSLIDLSALQPLYDALNTFADQMTNWIGTDAQKASSLNYAASIGLYMSTPYYTDIGVFMDKFDIAITGGTSLSNSVRTALASAVVYKRNYTSSSYEDRYDNACGLTIFHNIWVAQYSNIEYDPSLYSSVLTFGQNNAWGAYTQTLYDLTPPRPDTGVEPDEYEPDGLSDTVSNLLDIGSSSKQLHTFHLYEGDFDVMAVQLEAGKTYTFVTEAGAVGTDTILHLYDTDGYRITYHDDISSSNLYSKITYTAPSSGYYYLGVQDGYRSYGDYYIYFDQDTFGPEVGPSFNKWSPNTLDAKSLFD